MRSPPEKTKTTKLEYSKRAQKLYDFLHGRITNQDLAIERIVNCYEYTISPFKSDDELGGGFLFLGPSGSGKTYLAECCAEFFFGSPRAFTKIECENFTHNHHIDSLLGTPPGYVGHDHNVPILSQESIDAPAEKYFELGLLKKDQKMRELQQEMERLYKVFLNTTDKTEKNLKEKDYYAAVANYNMYRNSQIRHNEIFSIILFDELDLAHYTLWNILYEIIDKAQTHIRDGEITSFSKSLVFMTSNIGTKRITKVQGGIQDIGFNTPRVSKDLRQDIYDVAYDEAKKIFPTPFLGRLRVQDGIVVFNPLEEIDLMWILDSQLSILENWFISRLKSSNDFRCTFSLRSDDVKEFILKKSLGKSEYGARNIKSKIRKYIKDPLAKIFNTRNLKPDTKITARVENGKIIFTIGSAIINVGPRLDLDPDNPLSL